MIATAPHRSANGVKPINGEVQALEEQFTETASMAFMQLSAVEQSLVSARSSLQRLCMIQDSLNRLRRGKHTTGPRRMIKGLLG